MWRFLSGYAVVGTMFLGACATWCRSPEPGAIKAIIVVHRAEADYFAATRRYGTLDQLARANLISPSLAAGVKGYYRFEVRPSQKGYVILSEPLNRQGRHFYSDESLQIREEWDRPASSQSASLK